MRTDSPVSLLAVMQGFFYLTTGIWPILSRSMFEKVTGPKVDFWLVRTVGTLISVIGGVLLMAGLRKNVSTETAALAIASSAGLAGSDVIYASKKRISPVYFLDVLAETGLIALWVLALVGEQKRGDG